VRLAVTASVAIAVTVTVTVTVTIAIAIAIAITITVAVAVAIAITIAVAIAVTVAVTVAIAVTFGAMGPTNLTTRPGVPRRKALITQAWSTAATGAAFTARATLTAGARAALPAGSADTPDWRTAAPADGTARPGVSGRQRVDAVAAALRIGTGAPSPARTASVSIRAVAWAVRDAVAVARRLTAAPIGPARATRAATTTAASAAAGSGWNW
jgi:hypothetical protein